MKPRILREKEALRMKKRYNPPVWEMIRIQFRNDLLLTGSVETGGDILDSNNDDIPDVDPDTN